MRSEEYIQMLEKLMNHQDKQVGWIFFLIPLIIALVGFFQLKLSSEEKKLLREETDSKILESEKVLKGTIQDIDSNLKEMDRVLEQKINELNNDFKDVNRVLEQQIEGLRNDLKDTERALERQKDELEDKLDEKISNVSKQLAIRTGSNDNGYWIRYPDGTQICRHTIKIDREDSQKDIVWTFPAIFYGKKLNVFTEVEDSKKVKIIKVIKEERQTIMLLEKLQDFSKIGDTRINMMAIGNWKPTESK